MILVPLSNEFIENPPPLKKIWKTQAETKRFHFFKKILCQYNETYLISSYNKETKVAEILKKIFRHVHLQSTYFIFIIPTTKIAST